MNPKTVDTGSNIFIWVMVGLVVLWVLGYLGEQIGRKVLPSLPFLIIAGVIGMFAVAALGKIFG